MTSKERAKLRAQAMKLGCIFQIGKSGITPQTAVAVRDALKAREFVKLNVLKNCDDDIAELARLLSERTGSEVVQVIGRKIVLYKKNPKKEEKRKLALERGLKRKEHIKAKVKEGKKVKNTGRNTGKRNDSLGGRRQKVQSTRRRG